MLSHENALTPNARYGRKTYYAYDATDGRPIRTVTGTTPEFSLADYNAVLNLTRDTSSNADYVIIDQVYDADGHLVESYDPRQVETEYEYDARGRRTAEVAAVGTSVEARTETGYDDNSNVVEVRSPRYFDANDTLGYQKARETWTYTGRNLVASHTEAPGTSEAATESFTYDLNGRQIEREDFAGKIWKTHYEDCCGKVIASENPLGHGSLARKNAVGQSIHQVSFEDYSSHTAALDDPVDAKTHREITTRYDGQGRPIARTTWLVPLGTVDADSPPIAGDGGISASDGLTEQFLYDDNLADGAGLDSSSGLSPLVGSYSVNLQAALTKLAATEANGGAGISFAADAPGSARVSINGEEEVRFSISDASGRTVMSGILDPHDGSSPNSLITWNCTLHDSTTLVSGYGTCLETRSINALGKVNKQLSDAAGRTLQSIDALAKVTSYTYDASGNQLSVRDPNNVGQDCTYDELGRDLTCTDTASDATSSTYDLAGNKISVTDAKSNTTAYTFDARGRQTKQTDRISGETKFAYTATGQLASLTDAEDQVTGYTYDDAGQKLTEIYPDHVASATVGQTDYGIVTFTYDPAGRTLLRQDQAGDTVTYDYDLAGRLNSRDYRTAANSPSGTIADTDSFTYDDASRMLTAASGRYGNTVTYTYDDAGRKATEALTAASVTYTTTTSYDAAGQVSGYTYPDGTAVGRTYTDRGQLATLLYDSTTIDSRSYDDGGRMTSSAYNNGVSETRSYNTDNTLASISYSGASIGTLSYGWDDNKNKTSESISGTMSNYGFSVGTSGYDDEDRLVAWNRTSGLDQSWDLSLVGDWNSITENSSTQYRTHGDAHELLTADSQSLQHDVKGNQTLIPAVLRPGSSDPLALTWDFDNRLSSADVDNDSTADVTYQFDALGRRVGRDDGTSAMVYVQSGQQTIADYGSGVAATNPTYNYVYASYIDEPVLRDDGTNLRYFHRNQQYSITALTDASGAIVERYAYTAYGQPTFLDGSGTVLTASAEDNRYTYTGREWDEVLRLYHYRARIYDATEGRFVSRDPIGYEGAYNLFEYVRAKALNSVDPTGLIPPWDAGPGVNFHPNAPKDEELRDIYAMRPSDCVQRCWKANGAKKVIALLIPVQPTTSYPLKPYGKRPLGAPTPTWSTPLREICGKAVRPFTRFLNPMSNIITVGGVTYIIGSYVSCSGCIPKTRTRKPNDLLGQTAML